MAQSKHDINYVTTSKANMQINKEASSDAWFLSTLNNALMRSMGGSDSDPMHVRVATLTDVQRMFLAVDIFNREAMNDGIGHFFYYDCGDLYSSVTQGLHAIGLAPIAARLETYADTMFGSSYPLDCAARQDILNQDEERDEAAESAFGNYIHIEPQITQALTNWAKENRDAFAGLP